jgi:hypothetical protein
LSIVIWWFKPALKLPVAMQRWVGYMSFRYGFSRGWSTFTDAGRRWKARHHAGLCQRQTS